MKTGSWSLAGLTSRTEAAIEAVLDREGGYVDHPADRGGPTNFGITISTLSEWLGRPAAANDVKAISRHVAIAIYVDRYVKQPSLDRIDDDALFRYMVDASAHHGPRKAVKMLQKVVGATVDGILGPMTLATVNRLVASDILAALRKERALFMGKIVKNDPSQAAFLVGWLDRALG